MAFKLKSDDDDEIISQINIVPLVDVSLVLLIIFLVTANHILTPAIKIKLPQSSHVKTMSDVESLEISMSNEGVVYLMNKVVTLKELKTQLKTLSKKHPQKGVVFSVDKSVYFQRVVDVLDVLNDLGITKLDIRTKTN